MGYLSRWRFLWSGAPRPFGQWKRKPRILKAACLVAAGLASASSNAQLEPEGLSSPINVVAHINRIQIGLSAGVYLYVDASLSSLNCQSGQATFITLEYTHARYQEMLALLITAKATGRTVTLRIREVPENCPLMYIIGN